MTADAAGAAIAPLDTPTDLPLSARAKILLYLSVIVFLLGLGAPHLNLINIPIAFFLKNKLHFNAQQSSIFQFAAGGPLYLSFLMGFARDIWNPFGMRDRGFMILFGLSTAAIYTIFAFIPVSAATLVIGVMMMTTSYLFALAAQNGLTSAIGRQHVMSGQVSAVWNVVLSTPVFAASLIGGLLSDQLEGRNADQAARILFLVGAGLMVALALYAIWRPRFVYDNLHDEGASEFHPGEDLMRLLKHWPVYPALGIWFLWNFAPGSVTALQYYLQDHLHASDAQWGQWNAIFGASFIPTFLLYGLLCRRYSLRPLLLWGTVVAVPQFIPLLFAHTVNAALIAAVPIGLLGGVSSAAYVDLLIRSCPKGLEGTILMASVALYWIVGRCGDLLGTALYNHFGDFTVCVTAITVVYALILPVLFLVPKHLTATADGQAMEGGFDVEL